MLNRLLPTLNENQRTWISGYLAALSAAGCLAAGSAPAAVLHASPAAASPAAAVPAAPAEPLEATVLFGSQTDNCRGLAKKFAKQLEDQGVQVTLSAMSDYKTGNLKKVRNLFVLVSTHGEGEPPDNAIAFHEFLHGNRAPKLDGLRFSVLALGDTSYEFFCQTGKDFDLRLEELGGKRIAERADCDVDFAEQAAEWMTGILSALKQETPAVSTVSASSPDAAGEGEASAYDRSNPFAAPVLENLNLNGRGSDQETRHLELSLEGSGLIYEAGDSLGIYPKNHPELVAELISAMDWNPGDQVPVGKNGETAPLSDALGRRFEITVLTKPLVEQLARLAPDSGLAELLDSGQPQRLKAYTYGRDLLDLVRDYNLKGIPAADFISSLRKIPPRLYSISSSPAAYPDEVHVTVRAVRYEQGARNRYGVCSVQLAERAQPGTTLPVFIQRNSNFKLPESPEARVIMIGPGTGVAPFRSFLGEREETGAGGKNWLFFGDRRFSTDFLYQVEWQRWIKDGLLSRMDVAFSRDTDQKVYVQHRMLEQSKELYLWLQDGAYVYVCGDEKRMAHDVHAALQQILQSEGGLSEDEAGQYLLHMQQQKRYQRDVY